MTPVCFCVVVCVPPARLGPFGFLPMKDPNSKYGTGGLNGMDDVIVALKWIQANIKSFGGDPNQVSTSPEEKATKLFDTPCLTNLITPHPAPIARREDKCELYFFLFFFSSFFIMWAP